MVLPGASGYGHPRYADSMTEFRYASASARTRRVGPFALFWIAIESFAAMGLRWLNLGGGAGATT
jgi:hypothetical protein